MSAFWRAALGMIGGMKYVKVAISLPADLLDALDRVRADEGASRSEFFRQAIHARLDEHGRGAAQRYVEGYSTRPETDEEIAAARASAFALLGAEPWE